MSHEAKAAAAAALARVQKKDSKEFNTSLAAIKAQAKRELEAEQKLKEDLEKTKLEDKPESSNKKDYSCNGVFFRCPLVSEEVLPSKEWKDKVEGCVETLTKYIENIINHPDEEKYLKIRMSNRIA
uniref:PUB domain-containing protein n=1 Tax=Megaselia scalaris TaxID=36166 RepID=T1GJ83_MEGSC